MKPLALPSRKAGGKDKPIVRVVRASCRGILFYSGTATYFAMSLFPFSDFFFFFFFFGLPVTASYGEMIA